MNWIHVITEEQLDNIKEKSFTRPQLIFKHSIRCGISSMAKSRLERSQPPEGIDFYYVDLINYRPISNKLAQMFKIPHESPQVLLVRNGECIYDESHSGIRMEDIVERTDEF